MNQNLETTSSGKVENNIVLPYAFSIRKTLSESWARVSGFKATCWGALLFLILFQLGLSIIGMVLIYLKFKTLDNTPDMVFYKGIVNLIVLLASFPLLFGFYFLGIKRAANLPVKAKMIFGAYRFYGRLFAVLILQYVLIAIIAAIIGGIVFGLFQLQIVYPMGPVIAIIIPIIGVIIGLALLYVLLGLIMFSPYLVMDKNVGVFRAFKLSYRGFKQHGIKIFITLIILSILMTLSMIPFGIGLIWTLPLAIALIGVIYRTVFGVNVRQ